MSITLTLAGVKAKAGITTTDHDDAIEDLIDEWLPALTYALSPEARDSEHTGIIATLDLAATEFVAGELIAQLDRAPGARDEVRIGDLWVRKSDLGPLDPSGLKQQAQRRLAPFLRSDSSLVVHSGGGQHHGKNPQVAS